MDKKTVDEIMTRLLRLTLEASMRATRPITKPGAEQEWWTDPPK